MAGSSKDKPEMAEAEGTVSQQADEQTVEVMIPTPPSRPSMNSFNGRQCSWRRKKAQQWLNQRFADLTANDFKIHGEVLFYCAARLESPAGFEDHWYAYDDDAERAFHVTREQLVRVQDAAAVLLMCDFHVPSQIHHLCKVSEMLSQLDNPPAIFWAPHSNAEIANCDLPSNPLHEQVMRSGVDDVIHGEPKGISLAIAYLGRMTKFRAVSKRFCGELGRRQDFNVRAKYLQNNINHIVWDYMRARLCVDIPAMDADQPPGLPTHVNGCEVGQRLGKGSFGTVFALLNPDQSLSGEVLKVVDKSKISHVRGLRSVRHQIFIMSRVTQEAPHPGIIKFLEAYHTKTHIMFRMENGGKLNLFKRLMMREKDHELSLAKASSVILQAIEAVQHLHDVCHVAHRDIKPENACIQEHGDEITLKLTDFDSALVVRHGQRFDTMAGTFPFIAPEVHLQDSYMPFPSDVWSLGVLIAEILCGTSVIEKFVQISKPIRSNEQEREHTVDEVLMTKVAQKFAGGDSAGRMIGRHALPELRALAAPLRTLLNRMVLTDAMNRFLSSEVLHFYQNDLSV